MKLRWASIRRDSVNHSKIIHYQAYQIRPIKWGEGGPREKNEKRKSEIGKFFLRNSTFPVDNYAHSVHLIASLAPDESRIQKQM